MTYIYAYSNRKEGLSRLRRMAVLYKELLAKGIQVEMLTNDHRAANIVRDYGVPTCTTIETVFDIDIVAQRGDSLIMDTPEDDKGKLEVYVEMFESVERVSQSSEMESIYGEKILPGKPLIDSHYHAAKALEKEERTLLFIGDSDPQKKLLSYAEEITNGDVELLLGEYFYVGYEDALRALFPVQHEPDEYREVLSRSSKVITSDMQAAYEANTAGAEVSFFSDFIDKSQKEKMESIGIVIKNVIKT